MYRSEGTETVVEILNELYNGWSKEEMPDIIWSDNACKLYYNITKKLREGNESTKEQLENDFHIFFGGNTLFTNFFFRRLFNSVPKLIMSVLEKRLFFQHI